MQDTGNEDASDGLAVKNNMPSALDAPQASTDVVADAPERGISG